MLNRPFLQICCVFLILWSLLGGLLLPLSPNIEDISYTKHSDTLAFQLRIPKLKESLTDFYLKPSNDINNEGLKALKVEKDKLGTYHVDFLNPNIYKGSQKGLAFDVVAKTESAGYLNSFLAYYIDTAIDTLPLPVVKLEKIMTPFRISFPNRYILKESIRNLFFHVPMWFSMMALLLYSLVYSILYLAKGKIEYDIHAKNAAKVAMFFGILGILTGMIWAKYTWGAFWPKHESKLDGAAIGMLAYLAYFVLRASIEDSVKKAKLASVYNIFSFTIYMVFIWIIPRIYDSLHPGNGGNPGFNVYEQDNIMRVFFYPAVIGWIMFSFWLQAIYTKIDYRILGINKNI